MAENRFRPTKKGQLIDQAVTMFLEDSQTAFHGWESLVISKSIESVAHGIQFSLPRGQGDLRLIENAKTRIFVNQEPVVAGRIEKIDIDVASNQRNLKVKGRSFAGDIVDSSALGSEFRNIEFVDFARKLLSPFGIKIFLSVVPKKIDKIAVKPGESVFDVLDRAARLQGFFWVSTREGNLRLTRASVARGDTAIEENVNMLSGSLSIDTTQRHNRYIVKGQSSGTSQFFGPNASQPQGESRDSQITRHRPLIVLAEGNVNSSSARTRAQWEASTRLAKAYRLNVTVRGWQQKSGNLWDINQVLPIKSETLLVDGDFLVVSVENIRNNSQGTISRLELVRPDAYKTQPVIEPQSQTGILF